MARRPAGPWYRRNRGWYATTGEDGCLRRARSLWNFTRVLTLLAGNILIWGHVIVGLWRIWFS